LDHDIQDLLEACRARPGSVALQRALLDALQGQVSSEVLDLFTGSEPSVYDEGHRLRVAQLLNEAGRDEAAASWRNDGLPGEEQPPASSGATVLKLVRKSAGPEAEVVQSTGSRSPINFSGVGGLEQVKQQIRRKIIAPFEKPGLFQAFRKRSGGGVLMFGPPGCGKTMLARATAGEAKAHFIPVAITDILDKYVGESERKLATAFAQARARKPAILFFDELEALASRRRTSGEVGASLVSTFLSEMDGFSGDGDGVLVIGATNTPWAVDSAFRRPGRFDRVLFVPPPDQPARLAILNLLLTDRPMAQGLDLQRFVDATAGFSGADLSNLVETAVELAIEDSTSSEALTPISRRHLDAALKEMQPTTGEWLATARNYAKYANEGGVYDDVLAYIQAHGK